MQQPVIWLWLHSQLLLFSVNPISIALVDHYSRVTWIHKNLIFSLFSCHFLCRDVSEVYWKNLKWYTDLVWKSEFIIKPSKKGLKIKFQKNIYKYFEAKFSEIRQKSENLHPCLWKLFIYNFFFLILYNFTCWKFWGFFFFWSYTICVAENFEEKNIEMLPVPGMSPGLMVAPGGRRWAGGLSPSGTFPSGVLLAASACCFCWWW